MIYKTVALGVAVLAGAQAHSYKQCSGATDHMHVSGVTLNPDPIKAGGNLAASISVTPDEDITSGSVTLKVSAFGVTVLTQDFDLCKLAACPLKKGVAKNLAITYPIPSAAPAITAQAEFNVKNGSGSQIDCIDMDVSVVHSTTLFGAPKVTEINHQFMFTQWVKQFGKNYETKDFFNKYNVFKTNLLKIMSHESEGHDWSLSMNQFGDLTADEFKASYTGLKTNKFMASKNVADLSDVVASDSVDWRTKGAVSPVKDQGQCGSCWAFSTVGAVEGVLAIKNGKVQQYSEQELVDCAGSEGNQGCNGGLMDYGFEFVKKSGLCTETGYGAYTAADGTCKKSNCKASASISSYKDVTQGSESDLKKAVSLNPVAIAIEADQSGFQFYSGGVFTGACGKQLDHGVLVVGYGTDNSQDYWIVKNSWGATWGEQGYINIARGSDKCGIADSASYPVV